MAIELVLTVISIMAGCGALAYRMAKTQNRNRFACMLLGAAIPIAGIGLLLILGNKSEKSRR